MRKPSKTDPRLPPAGGFGGEAQENAGAAGSCVSAPRGSQGLGPARSDGCSPLGGTLLTANEREKETLELKGCSCRMLVSLMD